MKWDKIKWVMVGSECFCVLFQSTIEWVIYRPIPVTVTNAETRTVPNWLLTVQVYIPSSSFSTPNVWYSRHYQHCIRLAWNNWHFIVHLFSLLDYKMMSGNKNIINLFFWFSTLHSMQCCPNIDGDHIQ